MCPNSWVPQEGSAPACVARGGVADLLQPGEGRPFFHTEGRAPYSNRGSSSCSSTDEGELVFPGAILDEPGDKLARALRPGVAVAPRSAGLATRRACEACAFMGLLKSLLLPGLASLVPVAPFHLVLSSCLQSNIYQRLAFGSARTSSEKAAPRAADLCATHRTDHSVGLAYFLVQFLGFAEQLASLEVGEALAARMELPVHLASFLPETNGCLAGLFDGLLVRLSLIHFLPAQLGCSHLALAYLFLSRPTVL